MKNTCHHLTIPAPTPTGISAPTATQQMPNLGYKSQNNINYNSSDFDGDCNLQKVGLTKLQSVNQSLNESNI